MPKSKRHEPQAESEKISRATQASVERAGASTDEDEDVADNERDYESREADSDDWAKSAAAPPTRRPISTIFGRFCRRSSPPTRSSTT